MKNGIAEGKKEGIADGTKKEKIETATKLKKLNVDLDTIIQATGLPKEEIEKL